jgi:N-acetylmuramoyl-L-alanine amidase
MNREKVILMQRNKWRIGLVIAVLIGALFTMQSWLPIFIDEAHGQAILKQGSIGGGVWELQGRLKFLGFYNGQIDGHFGPKTKEAVIRFQQQFGLKADGIVGPMTKNKLWKATRAWNGQQTDTQDQSRNRAEKKQPAPASNRLGLSENDINLMANAVYGEARGEPYIGQVAVAAVIINRLNSDLFPNTVSGVIFEPRAFTAVQDGQIWLTPNETARQAVLDAINGMDPTGGCLYYFNPDTATSAWIWTRPQVKKIGKHIFCM